MTSSAATSAPWKAATQAEQWAGEVRVNLFRLIAIGGFYAHHLVDYYWLKVSFDHKYHLVVSGIAAAWACGAAALHMGLAWRWNPPWLKYAALAWDSFMTSCLLAYSGGPRSPFIVLLFLLIATSPLRLQLRVVWVASILSIAAYVFVCGHSRYMPPDWRVTTREHVIVLLALAGAGVLAGQSVRQARRLGLDFGDRLRPAETESKEGGSR
jgi:hypothetical protein